jgi:hypothetical protein
MEQKLFRYLWTVAYAWIAPRELLSKPGRSGPEAANRAPIPPLAFLALSSLIAAAIEKAVFPLSTPYELPEQLSILGRFVDFLPGGSAALTIVAAVCFTLVPYIALRLWRVSIPFPILMRAYCYQQGALVLPVIVLLAELPLAVYPSETYEGWIRHLGWATLPLSIFVIYWFVRQVKYEGYRGGLAVAIGLVVPWFAISALRANNLTPLQSFNITSGAMIPTLVPGDSFLETCGSTIGELRDREISSCFTHLEATKRSGWIALLDCRVTKFRCSMGSCSSTEKLPKEKRKPITF